MGTVSIRVKQIIIVDYVGFSAQPHTSYIRYVYAGCMTGLQYSLMTVYKYVGGVRILQTQAFFRECLYS